MARLLRLIHALAAPLIVGLVTQSDLAAQSTTATATLDLTVRAADSEEPLRGATVRIEGLGMRGITDQNGFVRITDLPPGPRRIEVQFLGYAPLDEIVVFDRNRTALINVMLWPRPIELAEVRVRARRSLLADRGFFERRRSAHGTFFTREEISAIQPRHLSDLLRTVTGIHVGAPSFGGLPPARSRGPSGSGRQCPIQFYVDGTLTHAFNIDEVMPRDVEGLEIYRGAATVPSVFNRGTANCGVIVIWTRID
jgi:outer membrane receptor for ferrienterochelin and colicins